MASHGNRKMRDEICGVASQFGFEFVRRTTGNRLFFRGPEGRSATVPEVYHDNRSLKGIASTFRNAQPGRRSI